MSKQRLIDANTFFGPDGRFATSGCVGYCEACHHWSKEGCRVILEAPTVDAVAVVHGKWHIDKSFMPFICTCSECGAVYDIDGAFEWHYCPICGAKMDGEKHD